MATYVPGVPQYLPTFKPFTPDFKYLSNVVDAKEQKYNSNHKALNDLYSKVVYGNLSREDTREMRDQFTENLGPKLQQISGMDLSMMQNAEAAKSIFKPFFEEDLIVKDLVTTKVYREEMQGAELLRNNPNKEMREMYWQTGVQKMQYEMEDFVNATEEDAMRMAAPKYTPESDLHEMAMAVLTESGLKTGDIEEFSKDGMWKITRANGDLISREALQLVQKTLKDDPRVIDAYHAKAFVESRQFADNGIKEGKYQNVNEGQVAWAAGKISKIEAQIAEQTKELVKEEKTAQNTATSWDVYRNEHDLIKGSKEAKLARESWSVVNAIKQKIKSNNAALSDTKSVDVSNPEEVVPENKQKLLHRAYGLMMNLNMESDLQSAALRYSNIGKKIEYEATELQKNKYQMAQIDRRHENAKKLADYNRTKDLEANPAVTGFEFIDEAVGAAGQLNTHTAKMVDGKLALHTDTQADQDAKYNKQNDILMRNKIDIALGGLAGLDKAGSTTALYTVPGIGKDKTMNQLQQIMQNGLSEGDEGIIAAIDTEYYRIEDLFDAKDAEVAAASDGKPYPKSEHYVALRGGMIDIESHQGAIDAADSAVKAALSRNLNRALTTELSKVEDAESFSKVFDQVLKNGMPTPFYEDAEGKTHRYTEDEYVKVWSTWAQSDKNKDNVKDTPLDDTRAMASAKEERTWNGSEYARLGFGQSAKVTRISDDPANHRPGKESPKEYAKWKSWALDGGPLPSHEQIILDHWIERGANPEKAFELLSSPDKNFNWHTTGFKNYAGEFTFQKDLADDASRDIYNSMYNLANNTATGALESIVGLEGAMFEYPDFNQYMKGVDIANMTPGDIASNPSYIAVVDPANADPNGAGVDFLKNIHYATQVDALGTDVYMNDVAFNEHQANEGFWSQSDQNKEILNPADGDSAGQANFDAGQAILKDYYMEIKRLQGAGTPTKSDYPIATIQYFPAWSGDKDDFSGGKAGYTITFGEDYMDKHRKSGGILDGLSGSNDGKPYILNVVIPSENDHNVRKAGEMNFSSVATQVASSTNGGYQYVAPLGGSLNITQTHTGQFQIDYSALQFDADAAEKGENMWKSVQETKLMTYKGVPITSLDRRYLDYFVNEYRGLLDNNGITNEADRTSWLASHPEMKVEGPTYQYDYK